MDKLRKLEYVNWPSITPVVKLNLVDQDINQGPWAMSLIPLDFAKKYKLLRKELPKGDQSLSRRKKQVKIGIIRGEANRVFSMQLGPYWQGVDKLPPHTRALFAIFAAKICRDRGGVEDLIKQINLSAESGQLNFNGVDALLKKHQDNKLVKKVVERHAYVTTVMASMLEKARTDGVFASAEFLWLKPLDRSLWFTLNSIGRQTPFPEVSGIFAHWLAEIALERKSLVPMVGEAVKGLEDAIRDIKLSDDDMEELK